MLINNVVYLPHWSEEDEVRKVFATLEEELETARRKKDAELPRELKLVRRCGFWKGFLLAFSSKSPLEEHFSWCPLSRKEESFGVVFKVCAPGEYRKLTKP